MKGSGGGGGGTGSVRDTGHSNASFVAEEGLNNQIIEKKKFAIEINDKDADYDPYQNRIVKHPTT